MDKGGRGVPWPYTGQHGRMKSNLLVYQMMSSLLKSGIKTQLFDPAYNSGE